jgi:CRP-like cAMP-binding protein
VEQAAVNIARPFPNMRGVCSACEARHVGFCSTLADRDIAAISAIRTSHRQVLSGADLYVQGELCPSYFIVLGGWIGLRIMLENGSGHMLDVALLGGLLGARPGPDSVMSHTASCLTAATLCIIPRDALDGVASEHPRIALRMAEVMACREGRIASHFANVAGRSARERVANLLFELFYRVRRRAPAAPGEEVEIPLTLAQIAEATALTTVHVNRMARQLREQGIVQFFRHALRVLDPQAFAQAARCDLDPAYFMDEGLRPEAGLDLARPSFVGIGHEFERWLARRDQVRSARR